MPRSDRSPSIVPPGNDQDVYLVLDDFGGRIGSAWRETDAEAARLETVIADLLEIANFIFWPRASKLDPGASGSRTIGEWTR